jgi:general secretion pathway protein A
MYLSYYGLRKEPFHITPDPEFLYLSPSHKEALAAIIYGIEQKKGFVAIIGDVGVGKTTILRSYLDSAERKHLKIIYVFNARLTFEGLLKTTFQDLEIENPPSDAMEMVNKLYEVLIEEYKQGNCVVLVIDEAQNMPLETLENLRMLSNLETSKDKLIQIVLVGQNEFEEGLNLNRLRQLKQRIAIRSRILPLTKTESLDYVKSRLQKAGSNHSSIFTNGALKNIINQANGIPRIMNILCDNALITGFGYQQKPVGSKIIKEVIADFNGAKRSSFARWWVPAASTLAAILLVVVWMWPYAIDLINKVGTLISSTQNEPVVSVKETKKETKIKDEVKQTESKASKQVEPPKVSEQTSKPDKIGPLNDEPKVQAQKPQADETKQATPRVPVSSTASTSKPPRRVKVVQKGDTLAELVQETYGRSDDKLLKTVQESNPTITDPNLIYSGSKIVFPAPPPQGEAGER